MNSFEIFSDLVARHLQSVCHFMCTTPMTHLWAHSVQVGNLLGHCMGLCLSTSLMTFTMLPTSPADNGWGQWVHCSLKCREHALWLSVS